MHGLLYGNIDIGAMAEGYTGPKQITHGPDVALRNARSIQESSTSRPFGFTALGINNVCGEIEPTVYLLEWSNSFSNY